jgi:hypothetical protein
LKMIIYGDLCRPSPSCWVGPKIRVADGVLPARAADWMGRSARTAAPRLLRPVPPHLLLPSHLLRIPAQQRRQPDRLRPRAGGILLGPRLQFPALAEAVDSEPSSGLHHQPPPELTINGEPGVWLVVPAARAEVDRDPVLGIPPSVRETAMTASPSVSSV